MSGIEKNQAVLFVGDSITDFGRDHSDPTSLGAGYVPMIGNFFQARRSDWNVTFLNRGVGGNRVDDLAARWQDDCLALNPDVVSILIGVNDGWRLSDNEPPTAIKQFEKTYRSLLTRTAARLVLCEPFLTVVYSKQAAWKESLALKQKVVHQLAKEFDAEFLPLQELFDYAVAEKGGDAEFWTPDGVHPSLPGHALIAEAWMRKMCPGLYTYKYSKPDGGVPCS